jgi:predicted acyl esterase
LNRLPAAGEQPQGGPFSDGARRRLATLVHTLAVQQHCRTATPRSGNNPTKTENAMTRALRLLPALAIVLTSNLGAQDLTDATYIKIGNDQTIVYPLPDDILAEYDHRLEMEDGVEISMNIYRPQTQDPVPVIMAFTSYNKDMWPSLWVTLTRGTPFRALGADLGSLTVSDEANWEAPDPCFWVPHGYALILVDARGTGKSTGENDPFSRRVHQDFANAVEWASEQPWSSGKIGTLGTSYLGITQWYVNSLRPRGLAAMAVWEGLTDLVRDAAFHGGIPETAFVPWWMAGHGSEIDPEEPTQFGLTDLPELPSMSFYTDYEIPPTDVGNINVPALVVSTWSNQGLHSRGGFEGYKRLNTEKYLYTHGRHEWTASNSDGVEPTRQKNTKEHSSTCISKETRLPETD